MQESIDQSQGIGKPTGDYQGLDAFSQLGDAKGTLPITQPQRMTLSGNLPAVDAPFSPVKQLSPAKRDPLQWTNRDGITTSPAPIRPIPAEQTLADVVKGREGQGVAASEGVNAPIGPPINAVGEIPKVGNSVDAPISVDAPVGQSEVVNTPTPQVQPSGTSRLSFPDTVTRGEITDPALTEQINNSTLNGETITNTRYPGSC